MEGDYKVNARGFQLVISIHALRMEGDHGCMRFKDLQAKISIHALRMEGDSFSSCFVITLFQFLSTPSGWRATP